MIKYQFSINDQNNNYQKRKQIRLKGYDYSEVGYYYITICTQNRLCLFGNVVGADPRVRPIPTMELNDVGEMANKYWLKIPIKFGNVQWDIYQIMPNHIHGILIIDGSTHGTNGQTHGSAPTIKPTLGTVVQWFKTMVTNEYIRNVKTNNLPNFNKRLFQRNYYEHIIRNEQELNEIREYIKTNPQMWDQDQNNPKFKELIT